MNGTIHIEDMRLFAKVAEAKSFTAAARLLGIPKQTLSRRVAELERALGVELMHRTTRRLHLSALGAAYAERCADMVRIADEANRAVADAHMVPRGTMRVTADPVFGEAFLTELVIEYARRWPEVRIDVVLTRRRVDLIQEGFDVAFRIGQVDDPALSGFSLGEARVRYCASPAYLARRGMPSSPEELKKHECLLVTSDQAPVRWPFRGEKGSEPVPVSGRMRLSSFVMSPGAGLANPAEPPSSGCVPRCARLLARMMRDVTGPDPARAMRQQVQPLRQFQNEIHGAGLLIAIVVGLHEN